jgi:3-oxoacyl-[acyl-carrier protein] reductase
MILSLQGKNALVRGGSQGIGRAIAMELADLGANVTLVSRNAEALKDVLKSLKSEKSQKHSYFVMDFLDWEKVRKDIPKLAETPFQILINNAGGPPPGLAIDAHPEEFLAAYSSHLLCSQIFVQALVPAMKAANYGRIINLISTSVKEPISSLGVSNTTRAAVAAWAKTLAGELGRYGITVNNVLPGATKTQRLDAIFENKAKKLNKSVEIISLEAKSEIPLGRFAEPSEIASAVAFLASPAAAYITGINLPVEGGRLKTL